jgi:hypothetical protein
MTTAEKDGEQTDGPTHGHLSVKWDSSYRPWGETKMKEGALKTGEPAGTRTQSPRLKRATRPKCQWLDFTKVSPSFLCKYGLEMILYIPLIL